MSRLGREISARYSSKLRAFWIQYKGNKMGMVGLIIILFFMMIVLMAPMLTQWDPYKMNTGPPFSPPSSEHPLGTNDMGQDLFSQLIYGARISLMVGLVAASVNVTVGTMVGLLSGYFGGKLDEFFMRLIDVMIIIPGIPIMVLIAAYLGPSIWNIIFILVIFGWTSIARVIRSQVLMIKEYPYIDASKAAGAGSFRIIFDHILPNIISLMLPQAILSVVGAILGEAGLSFLGLGDPTHVSWGMLLYYAEAYGAFLRKAWWWIIPPGLCITLVGLGFTFVGYALNDIFNPRLRR